MVCHRKLGEGTNMSVDSTQTSTCDESVAMYLNNSSVASSDSYTGVHHNGIRQVAGAATIGSSVGHSVFRSGQVTHSLNEDALAQALMDPSFPIQGLRDYDDWTLDLRLLNIGEPFAQGAFGKLYRGTYSGEEVAIKLLERHENDPEGAQLMEQPFVQEVMMLASLRHPNVVRFIGACKKPMVWCIVTEYAKGRSVREFLSRRQNRSAPLNIAVGQALNVAEEWLTFMDWASSMGT